MDALVFEDILLVDDNDFINYLNKNTLMEMGIAKNVHIFNDGFDALNYLKRCKADEVLPELIILDVIMPMVDGPEFIKWVKMLNLIQKSTTKIIALTGGGNDARLSEMKAIGIDAVLYKPLNKAVLQATIERLFHL